MLGFLPAIVCGCGCTYAQCHPHLVLVECGGRRLLTILWLVPVRAHLGIKSLSVALCLLISRTVPGTVNSPRRPSATNLGITARITGESREVAGPCQLLWRVGVLCQTDLDIDERTTRPYLLFEEKHISNASKERTFKTTFGRHCAPPLLVLPTSAHILARAEIRFDRFLYPFCMPGCFPVIVIIQTQLSL